ncbi:hypothetical protein QUF74_04150 [Candidatus Halobeggiatoa sp. HSG11]|nr:hypothetical protein [Candidatus Halobeggiatoa sp. HSG11]
MNLKIFGWITLLTVAIPIHAAPVNDDLDSAISIPTLPYTNTQDTSDSTTESSEDFPICSFSEASVWYQYNPTIDEKIVFDTYGSDYDTVLGVWTGEQHPLTKVTCNDNGTEDTMQSQLSAELTGGTQYLIGINGFNKETGNLTFNAKSLSISDSNNDSLTNAIEITTIPYTNTQQADIATTDANESLSVCASSAYNSVWYQYKSNTMQSLVFDTLNSDYNTVLSLWSGSKDSLTELACNDDVDDHYSHSQINVTLEANKTYYINISSRNELTTNSILVFNFNSTANVMKGSLGMAVDKIGSEIETESYFFNQIVTEQGLVGNQLQIDSTDTITVSAAVTIDDFDVAETVDILILALLHLETPVFFMRGNDYLTWELWNNDIPSIIAAEENVKLSSTLQSTIYEGSLAGLPLIPYTVYIGYRLKDGKIVFNGNDPISFEIK